MAARQLAVDASELSVSQGVVSSSRDARKLGYAELVAGKPLDVKLDTKVVLKSPALHQVVGKSVPRVDIAAKVTS